MFSYSLLLPFVIKYFFSKFQVNLKNVKINITHLLSLLNFIRVIAKPRREVLNTLILLCPAANIHVSHMCKSNFVKLTASEYTVGIIGSVFIYINNCSILCLTLRHSLRMALVRSIISDAAVACHTSKKLNLTNENVFTIPLVFIIRRSFAQHTHK